MTTTTAMTRVKTMAMTTATAMTTAKTAPMVEKGEKEHQPRGSPTQADGGCPR